MTFVHDQTAIAYSNRIDIFIANLSDFVCKERCVDDTIFHDKSLEKQWKQTIEFLNIVGRAGVILYPDRFQFAQSSVDFAGRGGKTF